MDQVPITIGSCIDSDENEELLMPWRSLDASIELEKKDDAAAEQIISEMKWICEEGAWQGSYVAMIRSPFSTYAFVHCYDRSADPVVPEGIPSKIVQEIVRYRVVKTQVNGLRMTKALSLGRKTTIQKYVRREREERKVSEGHIVQMATTEKDDVMPIVVASRHVPIFIGTLRANVDVPKHVQDAVTINALTFSSASASGERKDSTESEKYKVVRNAKSPWKMYLSVFYDIGPAMTTSTISSAILSDPKTLVDMTFQLLFTLSSIHSRFPLFEHGDWERAFSWHVDETDTPTLYLWTNEENKFCITKNVAETKSNIHAMFCALDQVELDGRGSLPYNSCCALRNIVLSGMRAAFISSKHSSHDVRERYIRKIMNKGMSFVYFVLERCSATSSAPIIQETYDRLEELLARADYDAEPHFPLLRFPNEQVLVRLKEIVSAVISIENSICLPISEDECCSGERLLYPICVKKGDDRDVFSMMSFLTNTKPSFLFTKAFGTLDASLHHASSENKRNACILADSRMPIFRGTTMEI